MGTKTFFTKKWPTKLGYYIAKWSPSFLGYIIAGMLARSIVWLKPDIYWTSLENYSHIYKDKSDRDLHKVVYRQQYNSMRFYYDLFHNIGHGRKNTEHFDPPVRIKPTSLGYINDALQSERGILFLGCHMASFDLGIIGSSEYLSKPIQALSLASPPSGFEFVNQLRAIGHVMVTPISANTLREAMERLKKGGVVLTGVDRPISEGNDAVTFFNDTAYLPTGYIRIALLTDCIVMTTAFFYEDDCYWIEVNPPLEMLRTGNRAEDIRVNIQRVLEQVEAFIRKDPTQWMMFLPVWSTGENTKTG